MKALKRFLAFGCLIVLAGCSTQQEPRTWEGLKPSQELLIPAPPLDPLAIDFTEDLVHSYLELASDRNIIADRLNILIEWILSATKEN